LVNIDGIVEAVLYIIRQNSRNRIGTQQCQNTEIMLTTFYYKSETKWSKNLFHCSWRPTKLFYFTFKCVTNLEQNTETIL